MQTMAQITLAGAGAMTSKRISRASIVRLTTEVSPDTHSDRKMRLSHDTARRLPLVVARSQAGTITRLTAVGFSREPTALSRTGIAPSCACVMTASRVLTNAVSVRVHTRE